MNFVETLAYILNSVSYHLFSPSAKFFRKTNISYPMTRTRTCVYKGVRNVSFPEKFGEDEVVLEEKNNEGVLLVFFNAISTIFILQNFNLQKFTSQITIKSCLPMKNSITRSLNIVAILTKKQRLKTNFC